MLRIQKILLVSAALTLVSAPAALATPVVYNYTGTTTFQNGEFLGQGSSVTGTIQFDDGLTDPNADPGVAQYNKTLLANAPLAGVFAYSITVGAVTKTGNGAVGTTAFLQMFDDATQTNDSVTFQVGTAPFDYLLLRALTGSGSDVVLVPPPAPGGFNPISAAIGVLNTLDPTQFGSSPSLWGGGANQVQFTWDTITLVPEPSTGVLLSLGLLGLGAVRRRRS
jgi:hypothetical protein